MKSAIALIAGLILIVGVSPYQRILGVQPLDESEARSLQIWHAFHASIDSVIKWKHLTYSSFGNSQLSLVNTLFPSRSLRFFHRIAGQFLQEREPLYWRFAGKEAHTTLLELEQNNEQLAASIAYFIHVIHMDLQYNADRINYAAAVEKWESDGTNESGEEPEGQRVIWTTLTYNIVSCVHVVWFSNYLFGDMDKLHRYFLEMVAKEANLRVEFAGHRRSYTDAEIDEPAAERFCVDLHYRHEKECRNHAVDAIIDQIIADEFRDLRYQIREWAAQKGYNRQNLARIKSMMIHTDRKRDARDDEKPAYVSVCVYIIDVF